MIKLDARLQAIYELVRNNSKITDVGADHGYLITKLILTKKCSIGNCVDINQKCLEKAKNTAFEHNVSKQINFFVSDGLREISEETTDDIVIAGMGSELISKIIDNCDWLKKINNKHLVLQPMNKPWVLRNYLYLNGFEIINEKVIKLQKFFYVIILAKFSGNKKQIPLIQKYTGCLSKNITPDVKDYFLFLSKKFELIADQIATNNHSEKYNKKYNNYKNISKSILDLII